MTMKEIKKTYHCPLSGDGEIILTITFGDGQNGTTFFEKPDGSFVSGSVTDIRLGPASELAGKKLILTSAIAKTNLDTEFASATYILEGGVSFKKSLSEVFELAQKAIRFIVTLDFTGHE